MRVFDSKFVPLWMKEVLGWCARECKGFKERKQKILGDDIIKMCDESCA